MIRAARACSSSQTFSGPPSVAQCATRERMPTSWRWRTSSTRCRVAIHVLDATEQLQEPCLGICPRPRFKDLLRAVPNTPMR
jgi:hypothetical protein